MKTTELTLKQQRIFSEYREKSAYKHLTDEQLIFILFNKNIIEDSKEFCKGIKTTITDNSFIFNFSQISREVNWRITDYVYWLAVLQYFYIYLFWIAQTFRNHLHLINDQRFYNDEVIQALKELRDSLPANKDVNLFITEKNPEAESNRQLPFVVEFEEGIPIKHNIEVKKIFLKYRKPFLYLFEQSVKLIKYYNEKLKEPEYTHAGKELDSVMSLISEVNLRLIKFIHRLAELILLGLIGDLTTKHEEYFNLLRNVADSINTESIEHRLKPNETEFIHSVKQFLKRYKK